MRTLTDTPAPPRAHPSGRPAAVERIAAVTDPLDALLATDGIYRLDPDAAAELRMTHLVRAVAHHRARNPVFDRYCADAGFDEGTIEREEDLARIPLLPSGLFKHQPQAVRTGSAGGRVIDTTSSGTNGTVSIIPRDDVTLMRFFSSVSIAHRDVLGIESFDRRIFNLGPPTHEAPNLWIAYVMAGVSVILTTRHYVRGGRFELERLVEELRGVREGEPVTIVSPPPLLLDVARALESTRPLGLGAGALVLTIGGWKRRAGEMIPREAFDRRIAGALGLADPSRVRDTYNMVEVNSVLFECAYHRKHAPPWLHVGARDPRTLAPVEPGRSGVLAFADPTPTSYPGFVLSDDLGTVERVACACGLSGDVVSVERRIRRVETRGCALKMDAPDGRTGAVAEVP